MKPLPPVIYDLKFLGFCNIRALSPDLSLPCVYAVFPHKLDILPAEAVLGLTGHPGNLAEP
jgi:hypothetical protein